MDIPYEKQFHFRDGTSISSLEELKSKIERISYQEFYHHVNTQKNDFAAWILHVFHDERLASDLRQVTSIVETVEILNDYLHPRSVETPRTDVQSQIEQGLFSTPLPLETADQFVVEQVPTVTPTQLKSGEFTQVNIVEEPKVDAKVSEELFGRQQPAQASQAPPGKEVEHTDDMTRMIIKDFMYGLLFGLIVGLILGRMLSF